MRLTLKILSLLPLAFLFQGPAEAGSRKSSPCESIAHIMVIGTEPTRVAGAAGCRATVLFQEKDVCVFYRSRKGGKTMGPVCLNAEKGNGGTNLGTVYEMWTKDFPFNVWVVPHP
jgi:hypothetical protein